MPRKFSPTGDRLSEHITEADALVADARLELNVLAEFLREKRQPRLAEYIEKDLAKLTKARDHLRAAEAIRLEMSARRQAALSREAKKRSE